MANLKRCVGFVVVVVSIVQSYCATTKYVSYNSTDLSYLSNGIQIPVPPSVEDESIDQDVSTEQLPDMEWMSRLYNHHNWKRRLTSVKNLECRSDLSVYLDELQNNTLWAIKMHDASGRYSSQFFFGNDYWLGSSTLCAELAIPEENAVLPPFPVYFYVGIIRINVNVNITPVTRQLHLGQCLPRSCTTSDIRRLLKQERSQATSLSVVSVRAVPGDYSMLQDIKFHILSAVTTFVLVLILISTAVDYCLSKDKDVEVTKQYGTTADPDFSKKSVKVGIFELPKNVLLCFSAITNGRRILNVDHLNKESIACLHGLRFFSISWIILVHSYLEVFAVADNKTLRTVTERSYLYQTISNGTFSVDTFFFISGLLLTTTYLKRELKTPTESGEAQRDGIGLSVAKNILLILYRYIRLTPAYLFVLGLNELAIRYYHNFSVFSPAIIDHISCPEHWWRNALYINNFYPLTEFCMLWSWYMSNDMQFFVIAIVLLAIAARNEKCFRWIVGTVVVFLFTSWVVTFIIAMQYKYVARIEEPFALFDQLYDKPWLRIGPYLIGMATGYLLLRMKYKMAMPKVVVFGAWVLSLGCLLVLVYGLGRDGLVIPVSAFYASLGHTAWGLAIAWITIACSTGYGGPIDSVLSFRGIYPLSRLTYCAYLIHPVIMCITSFEMDGPFHLHQIIMLIVHFGNTVASFVAAFFISLGFEAPFVGLIKIMTGGKR